MGSKKPRMPLETFDNNLFMEAIREYPSVDNLTSKEAHDLENRVRRLIDFEKNSKIPFHAANYISQWLKGKPNFEERSILDDPTKSRKAKYFFRDPWDGDSLIVIKEGRDPITEGFNLIITHSDSPCLRLKPKPIKIETDSNLYYSRLGVRLSATAHGGIRPSQWEGQQLQLIGYILENRKKREVGMPVLTIGPSAHIDYRESEEVKDAFKPEETFEIIPGHTTVKETLEKFELSSIDDFSQGKIFAVPTYDPIAIDEYTWRLLSAYGHDNKSCTFSAVDAIVKARNPRLTSIVWITDNEETGDTPPTGVDGPFLDQALDYILSQQELRKNGNYKINERKKRDILKKSSLIYADVNVAPAGMEEHNEELDLYNSPKIGLGMWIGAKNGEYSDISFLEKLRDYARRGATRGQNICHQIIGDVFHQDREQVWMNETYLKNNLMYFGQWTLDLGIPCTSLHNPTETICPGDELALFRFLRRYLQSNTGLDK